MRFHAHDGARIALSTLSVIAFLATTASAQVVPVNQGNGDNYARYPEVVDRKGPQRADLEEQRHFEHLADPQALGISAGGPLGSFLHTDEIDGLLAIVADSDDFEGGALGAQWTTASSTPDGRIQVTDAFGAASGTFALLMDTTVNGPNVLNEAVWTVDLSGLTAARLIFSHADFADEETGFSGPFMGSFNADGVAISADGLNWFPVFDAPSQSTGVWIQYEVDIGAAATAAGIGLGPNFQIKFQQYDNFSLTTDGRGYDAISIQTDGFDVDTYTVAVDPGQRISLVVDPAGPSQPVVDLSLGGTVIASAAAAAPGEDAVIQSIASKGKLTGNGGLPRIYTVTVRSVVPDPDTYRLSIQLNGAVEEESHDGRPNDSIAEAQSLESAFISLVKSVSGTLKGNLPDRAAVSAELGATERDGEDFESGGLDGQWTTASSLPQGRIQVTGAFGTAGGAFALLMDTTVNGPQNLNEAVWTVDLTGMTEARLSFFHAEWGDETNNFSGPFVGSFNADGVAISDDGVNWFPVLNPPNQSTGQWIQYEIDLAAEAAAAGMTLGAGFQIKFQQYDNFGLTTDGRGYDEILISSSEDDYYRVDLQAGDTVTVAGETTSGAGLSLELLDSNGNTLASGLTNAVYNGSFESGDLRGWTATTTGPEFRPWQATRSGRGGEFNLRGTDPADGRYVAWNGFDGEGPMQTSLWQDVTVPLGSPVLQWQDRVQWNLKLGARAYQGRRYDVELRDPSTNGLLTSLLSFSTGNQLTSPRGNTGWQTHTADLSAYAGTTVRLTFGQLVPERSTGPAQVEIDNVLLGVAGDVDAAIQNVVAPADGAYYVKASGLGTGYNLVVHRNSDFSIEDNDSIATAQAVGGRKVAGRRWLAGHVDDGTLDGSDFYVVQAIEGHTVKVDTYTPGDGTGGFVNDLDPMIRLWDSSGVLIASDDNSAGDGRNARLEWTTPMGASGDYFIEITSSTANAPTAGAYVMACKGHD